MTPDTKPPDPEQPLLDSNLTNLRKATDLLLSEHQRDLHKVFLHLFWLLDETMDEIKVLKEQVRKRDEMIKELTATAK